MPPPSSTNTPDNRWIVPLAGVGVLLLLVYTDRQALMQSVLRHVEALGIWGPVAFVVLYVFACVLLIPGSILTLGAGALFGVWKGSALVAVAATLGATVAFLIGRHFTRRWVENKLAAHPKFTALNEAISQGGWQTVLLTRLSPAFPFVLLNYAYGLTRISFKEYVLASWIGMLPGTVLYVYLGSLAQAGTQPEGKTSGQWALLAIGLCATFTVTWLITRRAKAVLHTRLNHSAGGKAS
jgi:uncharacterized membrane protein YdjX (TVP38/TMEM64 family)